VNTPPPAVITVVSPWSHDANALAITLEKLERKGYNTILVGLEKYERDVLNFFSARR